MKSLLAILAAATSAIAAAQPMDEFAFAVPIEGAVGEPFYRLVVPQSAYEGAAFADLRDLRVFNGGEELVPHALRSVSPKSQESEPVALALFPLHGPSGSRADDLELRVDRAGDKVSVRMHVRGDPGGGKVLLGYLIDASKLESPLSGLRLAWGPAGAGHLTAVRIEASDDLRHWESLVSDAPLGGLSHGGQRLERNTVEFRRQRAHYLRLTWAGSEGPIEIAGVRGLVPEQWAQADRMWKEVVARAGAAAPGDYAFDVGGHFPLDRLEFRLPQENSVVPLQVLSRDDPKQKWSFVASAVAYRIRQDGREVTGPPLVLGPNPHRYWLLRADVKGGGPGAGDIGVKAGWTPRELIFNARGSAPFRLAYGNPRAASTSLGVETLVPGLRTDQEPRIPLLATGPEQKLPGTSASVPSPAERKKWGLWAALAAGVAVLAWMAWQLSRQMNRTDERP
jgi:hypothetical protein